MEYVSFGTGTQSLVMIPGLGDGLKTVRGTAAAMAMMFREYGKSYRVYVFSRKNKLEKGCTIRDMAGDQKRAMEQLGIGKSHIMGISQGGMIAQYLAIDFSQLVDKLVLGVTAARANETMERVLASWCAMAEAEDYKSLFIDIMEKSYTEQYIKRYRRAYPVLTRIGRPRNFDRFLTQARAIACFDASEELQKIQCPTLVLGAAQDKIVGGKAAAELAGKIAGSRLLMYEDFGHGVYEEAKDFNRQVLDFLQA